MATNVALKSTMPREFNAEDFYADDDMIITISHMGYIKRTPLAEFRAQNRGGVGSRGSVTRDKDFIEHIYTASMHNTMLFFTDRGLVYKMPVYELPEGTRQTKGRALQNLLNIEPGDSVNAFIRCKGLDDPGIHLDALPRIRYPQWPYQENRAQRVCPLWLRVRKQFSSARATVL